MLSGVLTARFGVIDPHRVMQTCGLTDGFVRTGMIALTYGQLSLNATRCRRSFRQGQGYAAPSKSPHAGRFGECPGKSALGGQRPRRPRLLRACWLSATSPTTMKHAVEHVLCWKTGRRVSADGRMSRYQGER